MSMHVLYRNNVDYPYKAIVVTDADIDLSSAFIGCLMYYNNKMKKYTVAIDSKCDIMTGGIYAGELYVAKTKE